MDPSFHLVLRLGGALLLGSAALAKLRDVASFRDAVLGYALVPAPLAGATAAGLLAAELAAAAALLAPGAAGALGAAALLVVYAAAIAVNLVRGRRWIDCGCGGPGGRRALHGSLVARNLVVAAALAATALAPGPRALVALDALTVGAGVTALALLYAGADVALANQARLGASGEPASWPTR
jgi:hypothetical protein